MGARVELHGDDPGPPPQHPSRSSSALKKSPAERGQTGCLPCLDRRSGHSGAPCSRSSIIVPLLPTLDDPAPQMVEQLPDILHFLRAFSPDPEQAIEVPKILPVDVPLRTSVREPQLVEQLVEVPTIISFSSLQRIAEQNVDIPVVGGGGTGGSLSGFLPGQHYSMTAEQIVDNPVPRRSFSGDLQGFSPGQSSSKRTANKIADIPVPSGGPQDFPQTLHRAGVSSDLPDEANQGVFSYFSPG